MSRRTLLLSLAAVAVCAGVTAGLYAKAASASTPGVIALAGDVRVDEYVVRAPSVVAPTPDYTVGIPTTATASAPKKGAPASAGSSSRLPVVSGFLSDVLVAEGAHVKRGEVIARLDTTMLDLGVAQATTARTRALANVDVIDANLDKLATARAKLLKARASLTKARVQLVKARASLETTIALLKKQRSSLEASITAIQALIGQPGGPPPHIPPYPVLLQGLQQALAGLSKGLAGAQTGLAAMSKGLATMDKGFATMAKGLSQLDSARRQLRDVRALAVINVSAQDIAVRLANDRRAAATITSPVDGVVTFTRTPGTAVMVGAPLVNIRPDGLLRVTTYMTPDQLAQVHIGSRATVGFDSNTGAALTGSLEVIGDHAVVPPTSFPTAIVHMTRAVLVTIVLDEGQYAPPGTPVDVEIAANPGR
jgi:multidrug resistance efflux pump